MTLWTGFKQQNSESDETIGPNEEEEGAKYLSIAMQFHVKQLHYISRKNVVADLFSN